MTLLTIAQSLKTNILTNLQALVDAGALGSYMAIDRGKDLAQIDPPGPYPFAVVAPPSITADFEDTDNNWREYRFDIMIVQKYENLQSNTDIEGLMDAVLKSIR